MRSLLAAAFGCVLAVNVAACLHGESRAAEPEGSSGAECARDDDCQLVHECDCSCVVAPKSAGRVDCADAPCKQDGCAGKRAACEQARCVVR
ncbi:MAG: hypothetical protein U0271_16175 [Polyangiaceae bacterium]